MDSADFDATVAGFYRAATGALPWAAALEPVRRAFGARAAVLHTLDLESGRLLALRHAGSELERPIFEYVREYHRIDPRRQLVIDRGVDGLGQWNHDHESYDSAFMERHRFYRHFLPAVDARNCSNVGFAIAPTIVCGLALELHVDRGPLDNDERESARRLGVHLQEALLAYERIRKMA